MGRPRPSPRSVQPASRRAAMSSPRLCITLLLLFQLFEVIQEHLNVDVPLIGHHALDLRQRVFMVLDQSKREAVVLGEARVPRQYQKKLSIPTNSRVRSSPSARLYVTTCFTVGIVLMKCSIASS